MRVAVCLIFVLAPWIAAADTTRASAFTEIDQAVATLSEITGWKPLKKVQYDTMDRVALKAYLEGKVREEVKPEEIRAEEVILKKIGLVPQDFKLAQTMVDLLTEQAAAFYDYRKKKLFLLEGGDPAGQSMVVVHELAHALADQHFDLGKFIRKGKNDDSSLARMAVMEGQATWLMMESTTRRAGTSLKDMPPALLDMANSSSDAMASQFPVLAGAPLYIRASLLFPYAEGLRFNHIVVQKQGQAGFTKVFRDPPVSSQQILHPERYLSGVQPVEVELPKLPDQRHWRPLTGGALGEFDHSVLVEQYMGKARALEIAPHLRGASAAVLEHKRDKRAILLYSSEWDSPESARRMFDAYRQVMKGKWKTMSVSSETMDSFSGSGDDGAFRVWLSGARLSAIEGMAHAVAIQ